MSHYRLYSQFSKQPQESASTLIPPSTTSSALFYSHRLYHAEAWERLRKGIHELCRLSEKIGHRRGMIEPENSPKPLPFIHASQLVKGIIRQIDHFNVLAEEPTVTATSTPPLIR